MSSNIFDDFRLNPIGLGTNAVGNPNYNPISEEESHNMILTALDLGVNFFDSAFYYGMGHSEEVIGNVLKKCNARNKILLATKGAHKIAGGEIVVDNSPNFLVEEVYKSLKRLQTDYIDLYYIHFPDDKTPKYEAVGALQRLREKSLFRISEKTISHSYPTSLWLLVFSQESIIRIPTYLKEERRIRTSPQNMRRI